MAPHGVVSADSHVTEPADLWKERLAARYRERAPYVTRNPDSGPAWLFVAEGATPFPIAGGFAAGRSGEALAEFQDKGYEAARPSGWDPVERLADQDLDGIDAEILYPTLGMKLFAMPNGELQRACFEAYNGWLADYCRHDPRRLYGVGLVSLEDVALAVRDVEAIARQGHRGLMIWGAPPEDRPYDSPAYDPFWAAAADHGLPVSLHIIAGRGRTSGGVVDAIHGRTHPGVWYMSVLHEIQDSLSRIVFGGVLHRFPKLQIVSAENDVGCGPTRPRSRLASTCADSSTPPSRTIRSALRPMSSSAETTTCGPRTSPTPTRPSRIRVCGSTRTSRASRSRSDGECSATTWPSSTGWIYRLPEGAVYDSIRDRASTGVPAASATETLLLASRR